MPEHLAEVRFAVLWKIFRIVAKTKLFPLVNLLIVLLRKAIYKLVIKPSKFNVVVLKTLRAIWNFSYTLIQHVPPCIITYQLFIQLFHDQI